MDKLLKLKKYVLFAFTGYPEQKDHSLPKLGWEKIYSVSPSCDRILQCLPQQPQMEGPCFNHL